VVMIAKPPGVGPLSPPQPASPRIDILDKKAKHRILAKTLRRFMKILSV
jgi:hypothetical protein